MDKLKKVLRYYGLHSLKETACPENPFDLFHEWIDTAIREEVYEPNAMSLSSVNDQGQPSSRIVLLKEITPEGFIFFTNYHSRKANDLEQHPQAALLFWWPITERQVRIEGKVSKIAADISDAYFATRDRSSKIGAHVSSQSSVIPNREMLDQAFEKLDKQFSSDATIPRPDHWGGYLLTPQLFEFWQGGQHRLHDRICYQRHEQQWNKVRLAP